MNIDTITTKIAEEARLAASVTLENARARAEEIERRTARQNDEAQAGAMQEVQLETAQMRERLQRMAVLQEKKDTLVMKRQVIDEAFAVALRRMLMMTPQQAQELSLSLLVANAVGDEEVLFASGDEAVYDAAFLSRANEALKAAGKPGALTYAAERLPDRGGFVLRRGGMQMEMTWQTVLAVRRDDLEADVANLLFS